jgi:tRNA-dihydrouridine synthase
LLQRKKVIKKHLILLKEEFDEKHALLLIRQHIGYYLKGIKNKKEIMSKLFKVNSFEELYKIL